MFNGNVTKSEGEKRSKKKCCLKNEILEKRIGFELNVKTSHLGMNFGCILGVRFFFSLNDFPDRSMKDIYRYYKKITIFIVNILHGEEE